MADRNEMTHIAEVSEQRGVEFEDLYGDDLFGYPVKPDARGIIADKFTMPPFSVLNARDGFWQDRKRAWTSLGIESEIGRGEDLIGWGSAAEAFGKYKEQEGKSGQIKNLTGTSMFDPVLCELIYKWFCPVGGQVIDPFAGGSVRGIIASLLQRKYWGCDLAEKQIHANREQGERICDEDAQPEWVWGDALDEVIEAPFADFIFSCPPYGNLETYSDNPHDISTMDYPVFLKSYREIIVRTLARLMNNRFACFVVGDFRDEAGHYNNFISDTITAFRDAGAHYYNEGILLTQVGSLPIRITRQFDAGRKLGKTHQNFLVFVKGSWREAADYINAHDKNADQTRK